MSALVEADELYRFFHSGGEETRALRGVSLRVAAGEITAVTGPSGSGKSTLLACIAGLDEPDGGLVCIAGEPLSRRPEAERARLRSRCIGMLFQSGNLVDHLTVRRNMELVQSIHGRVDRRRCNEVLDSLGLADRAGANPPQLSGGEAARAGLAIAIANDPPVLLADEPTGELDGATEHAVLSLLRSRAKAGAAILVVTHSPAVAALADHTIALRDGQVTTS